MNKLWSKRNYKKVDVEHPMLVNLPAQSNEIVIQALLTKVRKGNQDACQEMVMEHRLLVKLKIQDFLGDYPYLRKELDDLVSVAFLAATDAVDRVRRGSMLEHNNITGYIRVAIWRCLGDWLTTYRQSTGKETSLPTGDDPDMDMILIGDDHACWEIKDICESLNLIEKEWYILESRQLGDTNDEIAEALDVTDFTVRFILGDIQRRFLEKYEVT